MIETTGKMLLRGERDREATHPISGQHTRQFRQLLQLTTHDGVRCWPMNEKGAPLVIPSHFLAYNIYDKNLFLALKLQKDGPTLYNIGSNEEGRV